MKSRLKKIAMEKTTRVGEEFVIVENGKYKLNPSVFGETSFTGDLVDSVTVDPDEMKDRGFSKVMYSFQGSDVNEANKIIETAKQNGIEARIDEFDAKRVFVELHF